MMGGDSRVKTRRLCRHAHVTDADREAPASGEKEDIVIGNIAKI